MSNKTKNSVIKRKKAKTQYDKAAAASTINPAVQKITTQVNTVQK